MSKVKVNPSAVQSNVPETIPILKEDLEKAVKEGINNFASEIGLVMVKSWIDDEVAQRCGAKYSHGEDSVHRYGSQQGWVTVAGQKRRIKKTRLRKKGGSEESLETYKRFQEPDAMQQSVLNRMMVHVSTRNYPRAIEAAADAAGIKRSSVSRQFKAASTVMLKKMRERRFDGRSFRVIYIDGKDYDGEMMIAALGIEDFQNRQKDGKKVLLGIRQGSTENTAVVTALLNDLRDRGVNLDQAILFVVDGSKALTAGIRRVCGDQALIQRCRVHKKKNVLRHLNDGRHPEFHRRFNEAVELPHKDAEEKLGKLVTWLEGINPDAAGSLKEGIDEIITVNRMKISPLLAKTLVTSNPIESVFSIGEEATRRVKRWRGGNMRLRWFACAMLDAENRLNRVKGCLFIAQFVDALEKEVARRKQEELEQVA